MIKPISALWCQCEKCSNEWLAKDMPARCWWCKARQWNGDSIAEQAKTAVNSDASSDNPGCRCGACSAARAS